MASPATHSASLEEIIPPSELSAVRRFLEDKPDLLNVLLEGHERLAVLFPTGRFLHEIDPEGEGKLRVTALTTEPYATAAAKFESFDNSWWRNNWDRFGLEIAFHMRFE